MSELRSRSLCCTCAHEEDCITVRDIVTPVIHCELFECGPLGCQPSETLRVQTQAPTLGNAPAPQEPEGLMGLCVNCDNRIDCGIRCHEGGIWHCEEYC